MAQNSKEWFEQLCKEAGLSETETTALVAAVGNEKISGKLNDFIKRGTDDYSAMQGRVRAADEKIGKYDEWFPKAKAEYDRLATEHAKAMAELEKMRTTGITPEFDPSKYLTKEDLVKVNDGLAQNFASVLKTTNRLTAEHTLRFKEAPDFEAIDKLATEMKVPIDVAYAKYIEPRVKEQEANERKEWEKRTREEVERDVRSRYKLPVDPTPTESAPIYTRFDSKDMPKDMDQELLATWHGSNK